MRATEKFPIISVTGTKGKTTVVRALSNIIHQLGENTLRVDTDGYYINEVKKGDLSESKKLFSLVPTVCPGKYILAMKRYYPNFSAIFEAAIGSSGTGGLGYGLHQIGIFTNVFEDHLGTSARLKSKLDLAKAKNFIFSRIDSKGYAVFNADDKYVCSQLWSIPKFRNVKLLPVGITFKNFNKNSHIHSGGKIITMENGWIVIVSKKESKKVIKPSEISWTFSGQFMPSVYNLMLIVAGLYAFNDGNISKMAISALKKYNLDKEGGRLTTLENKKRDIKIILDFAHEKFSLIEIAQLGNKIKRNRLIGIVRLAPDRTDEMIFNTGKVIAPYYDYLFIYDKIDGVTKKKYIGRKLDLKREVGEVSKLMYKGALKSKNKNVERIIIEENAIKKAARIARKGDVVIVISGDDHKRTLKYIKRFFKAKFV